jgi:prepilin-type N-terminal cleavage/methylation domain-containing protein
MHKTHSEAGFSLPELLVATLLLLIISGIVTEALLQITQSQTTIWNRTEMHSGIRGATELLQQEVGQAGRVTLPGKIRLQGNVAAGGPCDPGAPASNAVTVTLLTDSATEVATKGIYASAGPPAAYMLMTTMDGPDQETFKISSVLSATQVSACFAKAHAADTVVMPLGAFATGIIPDTGIVNGSGTDILKMFGDINGDGKMVYIEYTCDTAAGKLYRKVWDYDAVIKTAPTDSDVLLDNIVANPGGTACFTYQKDTVSVQGTPFTFVLDVAITLTVETEQIDPITRQRQRETKALLNVSPRNVFNAWMLAGIGYTDRIQSTPATVTSLLAPAS